MTSFMVMKEEILYGEKQAMIILRVKKDMIKYMEIGEMIR